MEVVILNDAREVATHGAALVEAMAYDRPALVEIVTDPALI